MKLIELGGVLSHTRKTSGIPNDFNLTGDET